MISMMIMKMQMNLMPLFGWFIWMRFMCLVFSIQLKIQIDIVISYKITEIRILAILLVF